MSANDDGLSTKLLHASSGRDAEPLGDAREVDRIALEVIEGPDRGRVLRAEGERCALGSHASNDLVLADETVSRFHCELLSTTAGTRIRDLGSTNGTWVDGVRVFDALVREGSQVALGAVVLRLCPDPERVRIPLSQDQAFGELVGTSESMRSVFDVLARAARAEATVLIVGETGTGKEGAAHALHGHSARARGPFVVVDCGAIPANLIESELFGHEKGAFTGALARHDGAFVQAQGGTVFLDEIGELPTDLQPKLLRVLEEKTVRPLGGRERRKVDVRIVAATNRDLRTEVNEGRFRSDLYYRLSVVKVVLPPLRQREGDLPALVRSLLERIGASPEQLARFGAPDFLARLARSAWPGNVRELRNHLERCLVLDAEAPLGDGENSHEETASGLLVDLSLSYTEARQHALASFERAYLTALLDKHGGNVSQAAREAGIDRVYLHRLMRRSAVTRK